MSTRRRLGEILVAHGAITEDELSGALDEQKQSDSSQRLGATIIKLGLASEQDIADALAAQLDLELADLGSETPTQEALQRVPASLAEKRDVLPLAIEAATLVVAVADPTDVILMDDLKLRSGLRSIRPKVATPTAIREAIPRAYGSTSDTQSLVQEIDVVEEEDDETIDVEDEMAQPVVRLANQILVDAIRLRSSDVHLEPTRQGARVRVRVDGILRPLTEVPRPVRAPLTSRLKILGGMDIAERRRPQDGRAMLNLAGDEVDVRMSTMPSMHGETLVMRLLRRRHEGVGLESLGMTDDIQRSYERALHQPQGIVLVTGPTGSGKTTTLYAGLTEVADIERNVITLEDPVEYELSGVNQTQINTKIGLTFASGMRTVLRQDPDVVLVGEIRDTETGKLAVEASMTGHLVLSTLHTNDAVSTLSRLNELGVEARLLASSLLLIVSQRLVRVVCDHCGEDSKPDEDVLERLDLPPDGLDGYRLRAGPGCGVCANTGYRGRTQVAEVLRNNVEVAELITQGVGDADLRRAARAAGMRSLREDALRVALEGVTSLEEVLRVTPDDPDFDTQDLLERLERFDGEGH